MLPLTLLVAAFLVIQIAEVVLACALRSSLLDRIRDKDAQLSRACTRIDFLETTIDEIRARELNTAPPAAVDPTPAKQPLPDSIREQLDQIDDPDGELEALARYRLDVDQADEETVSREVFD